MSHCPSHPMPRDCPTIGTCHLCEPGGYFARFEKIDVASPRPTIVTLGCVIAAFAFWRLCIWMGW